MPEQALIISSANQLLKQTDHSIRLNEDGICSGIASVYIKYFLSGRESDYFRLCHKLANPPAHYRIGDDEELDYFIYEVQLAFSPNTFILGARQSSLEKFLTIEGQPIKNEFNFGFQTTDSVWTTFFDAIKNNGRAYYISSMGHAIALSCENNQWSIVDSNYNLDSFTDTGAKNKIIVLTASELILELRRVFGYKADEMSGFSIRCFASPRQLKQGRYPQKHDFWPSEAVESVASSSNDPIKDNKSFNFAAEAYDYDTIDTIFKNNRVTRINLYHALVYNPEFVLRNFHQFDATFQYEALVITAQTARTDLLKNTVTLFKDKSKNELKSLLEANNPSLLEAGARSLNPENHDVILDLYDYAGIHFNELYNFNFYRLLKKISGHGQSSSLVRLTAIPRLSVNPEKIVDYIFSAAVKNNSSTLRFWLKKIRGKTGLPTLSPKLVLRTNLVNLRLLLNHGFTVEPALIAHAMKQSNPHIIKELALHLPDSAWKDFIIQVIDKQPVSEPIALFAEHDGLSAFTLLARFGENQLIQDNLPDVIEEGDKEKALITAMELGNTALVSLLMNLGCQTGNDTKFRLLEDNLKAGNTNIVDAVIASRPEARELFKKENQQLLMLLLANKKNQLFVECWPLLAEKEQDQLLANSLSRGNLPLFDLIGRHYDLDTVGASLFERRLQRFDSTLDPCNIFHAYVLFKRVSPPHIKRVLDKYHRHEQGSLLPALNAMLLYNMPDFAAAFLEPGYLTPEDHYRLQLQTMQSGRTDNLEFLIQHCPALLENLDSYRRLAEEGHYELLALYLKQHRLSDTATQLFLLDHAMTRRESPLLTLIKEMVYILANTLDLNEHIERLLDYAFVTDDRRLFHMLHSTGLLNHVLPADLFIRACREHSLRISNELLSQPISFANEQEIKKSLQTLFADLNMNQITELVYEKSLNHLSAFMATHHYSPTFSQLNLSIEDMVFDEGLSSSTSLRQLVIANTLDGADEAHGRQLIDQLNAPRPLHEGGLELIIQHASQPVFLRALMKPYPFNDIISLLIEREDWQVLIVLLQNREMSDLSDDLLHRLLPHADSLFIELVDYTMQRSDKDLRAGLNALLLDNSRLILARVFVNHRHALQQLIMEIEQQMRLNGRSLKAISYRYDLAESLMAMDRAIKEMEPRITHFIQQVNEHDHLYALSGNETLRAELMAIKADLDAFELSTHYFDQQEQLSHLFEALSLTSTEPQQRNSLTMEDRDDTSLESDDERPVLQEISAPEPLMPEDKSNPMVEELKRVMLAYIEQRRQKRDPILPFQFNKADKIDAATSVLKRVCSENTPDHDFITHRQRAALHDGQLFNALNGVTSQYHFQSVHDFIDEMNRPALIRALRAYQDMRARGDERYHPGFFRQFTKTEKINAVSKLLAILENEPVSQGVSERDINALKQGSLGRLINRHVNGRSFFLRVQMDHAINNQTVSLSQG
ncbi:hypothetical protein [Legionella sp. CNM-4043-24]|uniref:hypothetical protein n=1 Tax=Legionella sp. CNM-4043-24 TaxID=3421646 RepID=UPI00403AA858